MHVYHLVALVASIQSHHYIGQVLCIFHLDAATYLLRIRFADLGGFRSTDSDSGRFIFIVRFSFRQTQIQTISD
jgi:hypothetical protein